MSEPPATRTDALKILNRLFSAAHDLQFCRTDEVVEGLAFMRKVNPEMVKFVRDLVADEAVPQER